MKISKKCCSGLIAALAVFSISMGASATQLFVLPGESVSISTPTSIGRGSANFGSIDIQPEFGHMIIARDLTNGVGGLLINHGTLTNESNALLFNFSGTLTNEFDGTLDNSGTLENVEDGILANDGTLNNSGTLENESFATFNNTGTVDNSGTVTLQTGSFVTGAGTFAQTAGQTTVNGSMTQASVAINGGTLGGSGTVTAALSVGAAGTVGPGNSPGLLQVFGDADFLAGSTLAVELGGLAFGTGYDRLDVADDVATTGVTEGTVSLADGTVFDIDWFGAFTAGDGDFFDVLVADEFAPFNLLALIFDFGDAALGAGLAWETTLVDFGGGREALRLSVVGTATEVPAPGMIAIFALGLAGLGYARRQKAA